MAIVAEDIEIALSGGAANVDPAKSLGGAIATQAGGGTFDIADNQRNTLFDDISEAESVAGDVEYRGGYVKNTHPTLTYSAVRVWIQVPTTSPRTGLEVGVAVQGVNTPMATIPDEQTAPSGVAFSAPTTAATGLLLGDLAPGEWRGFWLKRTVLASPDSANDTCTISVTGDSL